MKRTELNQLIREEWDKDVDVKSTGENAGKTIAQLKSQMANLKGKKPFDRKKYSELEFALRAKQGWKKGEGATESVSSDKPAINELFWPQSKLSKSFVLRLKPELDKKFKGHMIYGKGYDIYVDDNKVMTVDPDTDSINSIVQKISKSLHESLVEAEGPTKGFNGVAGKYQDLLKQKQDAIKAMKDFLGREKDPGKRTAEIKKYNSAMAKLNAKIAEHERRFTKAMLAIKDVDNEDDLL